MSVGVHGPRPDRDNHGHHDVVSVGAARPEEHLIQQIQQMRQLAEQVQKIGLEADVARRRAFDQYEDRLQERGRRISRLQEDLAVAREGHHELEERIAELEAQARRDRSALRDALIFGPAVAKREESLPQSFTGILHTLANRYRDEAPRSGNTLERFSDWVREWLDEGLVDEQRDDPDEAVSFATTCIETALSYDDLDPSIELPLQRARAALRGEDVEDLEGGDDA